MQTLLESRYVTAMGVRFHYLTAGKGAPVLLLHGFPENCRSFDGNAEALIDAGFELYIPDLKGYGLSDRPTPGTPGGLMIMLAHYGTGDSTLLVFQFLHGGR